MDAEPLNKFKGSMANLSFSDLFYSLTANWEINVDKVNKKKNN